MVSEKVYKKTFIVCPHCGKITDAVRGMGIWWNKRCAQCNTKIRVWNMRRSIVTCQSCGNEVIYNALSSAPEYCPSCHNKLENPVNKDKFKTVPCPTCGTGIMVKADEGSAHCALCDTTFDVEHELAKKKQRTGTTPLLIQCSANVKDILWKYPNNNFPRGTQLVVNEGTAAIILQNGALRTVAGPGSYSLEDSSLSLEAKLQSDSSQVYSTDVFFVQERPAIEYNWGTANPYALRDGDRTYYVKAHGRLRLCVTDPMQLARNLNFTSLDVSGQRDEDSSNLIAALVSDQVGQCFGAPLQEIIRSEGLRLRSLTATDVQDRLIAPINRRLDVFGLEIAENTFIIEGLETKETAISEQDKRIRQAMEKPVSWRTQALDIHMKDNPSRRAELILGGSVTPQVFDINVLENSSLDVNGSDMATRISDILTGLFNQILQKMIDDTGVDLRNMNQYYSYLQSTTTECLNFAFQQFGLSFSNVTIRQESLTPSAMLKSYYENEVRLVKMTDDAEMRKREMLEEENMRRFTQDIRIREKSETGAYEVELLRIETETEESKQPYSARLNDIEAAKVDADTDLQIHKNEALNRVHLSDLKNQQKLNEQNYASEIAELAHAVDVRDMVHRIEASDLSWQEKLDEYARLQRVQTLSDNRDAKKGDAEVELEIQRGRFGLTREMEEFRNRLKDLEADRAENQKQAAFTRDLEMKSALWSAEYNALELRVELEKAKAQLDYLARQNISKAYFEQARAAGEREYAERLRAQKDRDDETFEKRSMELLDQMRGFKDTLAGDSARQQIFDSVSKETFDSILTALTSVVDSLARAKGASDPGAGTAAGAGRPTNGSPYTGGANFTPRGIND